MRFDWKILSFLSLILVYIKNMEIYFLNIRLVQKCYNSSKSKSITRAIKRNYISIFFQFKNLYVFIFKLLNIGFSYKKKHEHALHEKMPKFKKNFRWMYFNFGIFFVKKIFIFFLVN